MKKQRQQLDKRIKSAMKKKAAAKKPKSVSKQCAKTLPDGRRCARLVAQTRRRYCMSHSKTWPSRDALPAVAAAAAAIVPVAAQPTVA